MTLLDIIGPVMIGPSSSHTAGAVRIGFLARLIWNRPIKTAKLWLRNSFAATYWGHGTDKGLIGGLLGMQPDDTRIPRSFEMAEKKGLEFCFETERVDDAPVNSVRILLSDGKDSMEIVGSSIGGGAVEIISIDGFPMNVNGNLPTLIVFHQDKPGVLASVTATILRMQMNVARMSSARKGRGDDAIVVIELDAHPDLLDVQQIQDSLPSTARVIMVPAMSEV